MLTVLAKTVKFTKLENAGSKAGFLISHVCMFLQIFSTHFSSFIIFENLKAFAMIFLSVTPNSYEPLF